MRLDMVMILCMIIVIGAALPGLCTGDFIVSYWCGPRSDMDPNVRYAEVAECNFNYCLPPVNGVTVEQNKAILDACAKYGLKYIIPDLRVLAKEPDAPDFAKNLDAVIADYAGHPATGGYYLKDEPNSSLFPKLAAVNRYLLEKDPKHLPFINLYPNYANQKQLGNATYEEHVRQFCDVVKPKILSYDHYTMLADDPEQPVKWLGSYFENMAIIREEGLKHGIPTCFIMMVTPHGSYRNPTEEDLRWQINTALAYGYKAIIYFTYWVPPGDGTWHFHNAVITWEGERTEHYDQVKRINAELKALGPTLMKLTSTGVYHTGELPDGCKPPDPKLPIHIASGEPAIMGVFRHEDGSTWAMLVNRDLRKPITLTLKFNASVKTVRELSRKTGWPATLELNNRALTLDLKSGEGRLLKLCSAK